MNHNRPLILHPLLYIIIIDLGYISLYTTHDDVYFVCAIRVLEYSVKLCGDILSRPSIERKDSFHCLLLKGRQVGVIKQRLSNHLSSIFYCITLGYPVNEQGYSGIVLYCLTGCKGFVDPLPFGGTGDIRCAPDSSLLYVSSI